MIQKLDLLVIEGDGVSVHGHQARVNPGVRSEEIEIAFLREKQKRASS